MPVVVQIDAYDPVGGLPVTLRAGSLDDPGVCHLGDMLWWPALSKLPTLRYDLFDGSFAAQITAPTSSLTLQIEQWPDFGRYALANARIRLWTGAAGTDWSAWTLRFDGRVSAQPKVAGAAASVDFGVDDSWLDAALLTTYAGTTGIEGPAELKGQAKPLALGAPRYVPGKLIDSINSVFQISAYGAIGGVEAALEKLARFSAPVGDRPSYASLVAADIPAGRWATCRASGLVRFGAPPEGLITFLAQGDIAGSDGWARTPGKLIRRLATLSGGAGKIDDASLNALDAARPYNLSLYVEEQTTARELIQRIAASCNAVAGVSWTGKLFVLPIGLGPASLTLSADGSTLPPVRSVEQIAIQAPWRRLAIGAERTWTVHALSDIAFTAALVDAGAYDAETTYREGNIVSLPNGSRWLYIGTTPAAGRRPSVADADHWSSLNPATKAGDIAYDDGRTLEDLKPAEPGATNSADPNSPFGSGGKKVRDALQMMERVPQIAAQIEPIKTDVSALKDATVGHDAALGALGGRLTASEQEIAALRAVDGAASDALVALGTVVADQGAAQRQATRDVGRIEDALLRALMESARTRTVLRDAGIVVDPATGVVRIYAVDQLRDRTAIAELAIDAVKATVSTKASVNYVDEQLALAVLDPSQVAELEPLIARMTQAESEIDGLNAKVALKASATDLTALTGRTRAAELTIDALGGAVAAKAESAIVDAIGLRLGSAEQRLDALPDTTGYSIVVRQARGVADGAAEAGLRALLAGDAASRYQLTQIAQARQDLTATIIDGLSAEALARTALSARVAESTALTLTESRASLARDAALTERIDAQAVAMDGQAAAIGRLDRAAIDAAGGIASSQMLIRQQIGAADQSDEALLRALLTGDAANRDQNAQLALIRTDFTTTLIANEQAAAVARQALLVRMTAAEAAIVTTSKVLADTTGAYGSRIGAIELAFADPLNGLGATRLRIDAVEEGSATRDAALGRRTDAIVAQIDDPVKGLAATLALATATQTAQVDGDKALTTRIDAQGAVLGDQAAAIGELRTASIEAGRGIAGVQMTIRQQVGAADEAGEALLRALIAGDDASRARAAQLVQVQTELSTTIVANELASAIARQALLARLGAAESAIVTTSKVQADATQALATRQAALEAAFGDAATGLVATRARIVALEEAVATNKAATARRLDLLDASLVDPDTGKAITGATVAADRRASVTRDEANASDLRQLTAEVNDPALGLGATRAGLTALGEAVASDRAASAQTIQEVRASITATAAATAATAEEKRAEGEGRLKTNIDDNYDRVHGELTDVDQARKSGDAANQALIQTLDGRVTDLARATADQNGVLAESIRQVSTTVGDHTTTISFLLRSLDGKEATAQLTIDANGKVTGFVINGQQSVFAVAADKFIVGNSQIFEIDTATGQTVVNAIKAGIITAREIAAGAVQQTIFAVTDADIVIQYG